MAKVTIKEAIAKSALNQFDLRFPHLTTQGFGVAQPTLCTEVVPRDKFQIGYGYQSLLAPLANPAFTDIQNITRMFFVPMESIWPHFKDMYSDSTDPSLSNVNVPVIHNNNIVNRFITSSHNLASRVVADEKIYIKDGYLSDSLGRIILVDTTTGEAYGSHRYFFAGIQNDRLVVYAAPDNIAPDNINYVDALHDDNSNTYKLLWIPESMTSPFQQGELILSKNPTIPITASASSWGQTSLIGLNGYNYIPNNQITFAEVNLNYEVLSAPADVLTNYVAGVPNNVFSYEVSTDGTHAFDFYVSGNTYKFTYLGRSLYKILLGLGYNINFTLSDTTAMSALPLLAYLRVWYDFLYPSAYVQSLGFASLFDASISDYSYTILNQLEKVLLVPYRQDYFTAAWKEFMQVGNKSYVASMAGTSPDNLSSNVNVVNGNQNPKLNLSSNNPTLTQYGLKVLSALTDWLVRNNVAGSRFFEQMRAKFGVSDYDVDPTRSMYVDSVISRIQIGDTLASTATDTQLLGERAGVGSAKDGSQIHFENRTGQFGYFIAVSMIMPNVDYFQGRDRQLQHLDKFTFFDPTFERTAMQAIRNDELFADYHNDADYTAGQNYGGNPGNRFGFAHRYSEYKHGRGTISGDFRCDSRNTGLDSYHSMRVIDKPSLSTPLALGINFLTMDDQFARLFAQLKDTYNEPIDHFVSMFQFNIHATRPMMKISEQFMIEEGGELTTINEGGTQL